MKDRSLISVIGFYLVLMAVCVGCYLMINTHGKALFPHEVVSDSGVKNTLHQFNQVLHVLLALSVVIAAARIVGMIFSFMNQPAVIGEVIGGILLGPSLLGKYAPDVSAYLLPPSVAPFLGVISQLGVILYMFLVGLELDLKVLRKSGHATLAISHASIVVPFLSGAWLALEIYGDLAPEGVSFTSFSLFLGVSMSVTAFPVLARILTDKKLQKTRLGIVALTCAAVDDVTAWCLLAFVVSVAQATISSAISTLALTFLYIAFMFIVMKPVVARAVLGLEKYERVAEGELAVICLGILLSALATEYIGIHAIFGAFLFGVIIPHQSTVARDLTNRLQDLVRVLFLPAFFAFTGMRTEISLVSSAADWWMCGALILIATVGKFGGTLLAARFTGVNWRESLALGILMNTRGLVELIVLNIGLDLKVISPRLFTMLVIMALVTTFMTGPLLDWILNFGKSQSPDPKKL